MADASPARASVSATPRGSLRVRRAFAARRDARRALRMPATTPPSGASMRARTTDSSATGREGDGLARGFAAPGTKSAKSRPSGPRPGARGDRGASSAGKAPREGRDARASPATRRGEKRRRRGETPRRGDSRASSRGNSAARSAPVSRNAPTLVGRRDPRVVARAAGVEPPAGSLARSSLARAIADASVSTPKRDPSRCFATAAVSPPSSIPPPLAPPPPRDRSVLARDRLFILVRRSSSVLVDVHERRLRLERGGA